MQYHPVIVTLVDVSTSNHIQSEYRIYHLHIAHVFCSTMIMTKDKQHTLKQI